MSIKIAADSTCDLSRELCQEYNISVLPLHINLGEVSYLDGVDIFPDDIFSWADANKTTPTTSAPSIQEAIDFLKPLAEAYDDIFVFTISRPMSSCNNVVTLAAQELEIADRVHIIDSENLSNGAGLLVVKAAKMAQKGCNAAEIEKEIRSLIPRINCSFIVDSLTYLYRGGRCSGLSMLVGSTLQIHPKISVCNGSMHSTKKYRGHIEYAIMTYVNDLRDAICRADKDIIFINSSGVPVDIVDEVIRTVRDCGDFEHIYCCRAGGVISSHCGPMTFSVVFADN